MLVSLGQNKVNKLKAFNPQPKKGLNVKFVGNSTYKNNSLEPSPKLSTLKKIALIATTTLAMGGLAFVVLKNKKISPNQFKDNRYKDFLIKGLKEKFNINVKNENLKSVMGADEFKNTIKKYSPEDFSIGNHLSNDPKEVFKNVIDGKFRVTLHNHSNFSDGRLSAQEFIDMAAQYADKVAKKLPETDKRPPFIIALTDHDNFDGCQEIIKIISQNPEKYKNLKFVAGSELSVKKDGKHFDLTALGVNPFDKNLNKYVNDIKANRTNSAKNFITDINELTNQNITLEQVVEVGRKGKKTLENKSGVVYLVDTMKVLKKISAPKHSEQIDRLFNQSKVSYKDTPDFELAIDVSKKANGVLSLTHPARSFRNVDENYFKGLLQDLKNKGISGIEANYQYTSTHHEQIGSIGKINDLSNEFIKNNDMFASGGTDSHGANIFGHHHKVDDELLKKFLF